MNSVESPQHNPVLLCLGALLLAAIFSSAYVFGIYAAAMSGGLPIAIGAAILGCPFGIVGITTFVSAGVHFLNVFNPRASLVINNAQIRRRRTLQIRWTLRGAIHRIQCLKIILHGMEKSDNAYHFVLRNPLKAKDVFQTIEVYATTTVEEFRRGQTSWTVPDEIPLSTGSAQMEWNVRLQAVIQFWPDVYAEVPLQIVDHI